ncbi:MAG: ECF transporter S component [Clostridia bacterium]|nr:ECF transporter S component [Clostridia bacterium]
MQNSGEKFFTTKNIVYLAILTALLIVLNLLGSVFKIVTNVNLTLIPIVLGALMLGIKGGIILGVISGLMTFIFGVTGVDPFTQFLFSQHPVLTFLTCTVKITAAGALGGLVYKLISKKNTYVATFVASAVVPVVNTALFIVGALTMYDSISALASPDGYGVVYFLVIVCAGVNFLIELAINVLVAPAIHTTVRVLEKNVFKR